MQLVQSLLKSQNCMRWRGEAKLAIVLKTLKLSQEVQAQAGGRQGM